MSDNTSAKERGVLFFGFALGIVLGVSLTWWGVSRLAGEITSIVSGLVGVIVGGAVLALLIGLFRGRLLTLMGLPAEASLEALVEPASAAVRAAAAGEVDAAGEAAAVAARRMASLVTWVRMRHWIVVSMLSLLIAFATLVGEALIYEQNALIEKQNAYFQEQNRQMEQTHLLDRRARLRLELFDARPCPGPDPGPEPLCPAVRIRAEAAKQLVVVARRLGAGVANAKGADLTSARLFGADLRDADLHRSDLRWADLRGADLRGAKLDSADLRDADLSWADLRGVDLSTTRMDGARLTQARHSRATRWPKGLPGKASGAVAIDDKAPCARCCAAFEAGLEHERARRSGLNQPGVGDVRLLRVFLAPFDPRLPRSLVSEARAGATDPWGGRLRQAYLRQSDSSSTALDKASRLLELAGPDALSAFLAGRSSAAANKARRTKASAAWGCR